MKKVTVGGVCSSLLVSFTIQVALSITATCIFLACIESVPTLASHNTGLLDISVDQDQDGLLDSEEESVYGTSPVLADTDGDGFNDHVELMEYGFDPTHDLTKFNPLIADLPQLSFHVTSMPIVKLIGTAANGTTMATAASEETVSANNFTSSRTDTFTQSVEMIHRVGFHFDWGFGVAPFGNNALATGLAYDFNYATINAQSVSFSDSVSKTIIRGLGNVLTHTDQNTTTYTGGSLMVTTRLHNPGNIAYTLSGIAISAMHIEPSDRTQFVPLTTLTLQAPYPQTFAPDDGQDNVIFHSDTLTVWDTVQWLRDPGGLNLAVSSMEMADATGTSFAHAGTAIHAKTALVVLDFGPTRAIEKYLVATNVERDRGNRPRGIPLERVLREQLLVPLHTEQTNVFSVTSGVLGTAIRPTAVRGVQEDVSANAYWMVVTNSQSVAGREFYDFADVVLKSSDYAQLIYMRDQDRDGLGIREEAMYGTSDLLADTDGDGISDYDEVRTGWWIPAYAHNAFSNPTSAEDMDGDTWNDPIEREHHTDPAALDTDGDGIADNLDTDQPQP